MPGYVIEFNRRDGSRRVTEFPGVTGSREALLLRLELERLREDPDVEIVSLNGPSLQQVQETHSRYFLGEELSNAS